MPRDSHLGFAFYIWNIFQLSHLASASVAWNDFPLHFSSFFILLLFSFLCFCFFCFFWFKWPRVTNNENFSWSFHLAPPSPLPPNRILKSRQGSLYSAHKNTTKKKVVELFLEYGFFRLSTKFKAAEILQNIFTLTSLWGGKFCNIIVDGITE